MHEMYELRDMLCRELGEYGKKELSAGSLSTIDTLAHAIKNIDKIIEDDEGEYSSRGSYRGSYRNAYSRRRDSMGRYSRDGMVDRLREMMDEAPDDRTRQEIQRLVSKMETM